ncbi:PP2C family protein-serine/threonine phosphatase [Mycolicibacterium mengxianglii]|uniref:PP2C family protein-serine/threonine phosphatase n=1 Tax=Mycolicibacterium mengxianglii TaxID=2736649 RepID=UPI0018EEF57C|nr:GAF domain-containing SpoIIE family protein phosphatase [Mycolicibacterium mengxianglii]
MVARQKVARQKSAAFRKSAVAVPPDARTQEPPQPTSALANDFGEEVTLTLAGSLNVRRTALRLLSMVRPRLADWAVLVLVDRQTGGLSVYGGDQPDFRAAIHAATVAGTGLYRTLRTGRTTLLHVPLGTPADQVLADMIPHRAVYEQVAGLRPADVLSLGLTARGGTVGALILVRGPGRGFADGDVAVAEHLAVRAALALDSAQLYEESGRVVSALTDGLRPPNLPEVEGLRIAARYRPAAEHLELGGDFYDLHGAGNDWLLTIGDVCGKGVEAAALTGRTRQSIRTAAYFDRSPAAVAGALNSVLYDTGTAPFVTVVCARVHTEPSGDHADVEMIAAGHPAPILLRANGSVTQVDVSGAAAGMLPTVTYLPAQVRLDRGDTLLMYTDGIDEARGVDGLFGVERLLEFLPAYTGAAPGVVCEAVEQRVLEHLDGHPHDDMALLAVTCGT